MIYYFTPYSLDKDIGKSYNQLMDLLPNDEDYACFLDGDAMFTTPDFGHTLDNIVKSNPEVPLFTCVTNRVGTGYQCIDKAWNVEKMSDHRKIGAYLSKEMKNVLTDITTWSPLSGVMILIRKKEWRECGGFKEGIGMLGVDNSIHYNIRNKGYRVMMINEVYVMHYYRGGDQANKGHLL